MGRAFGKSVRKSAVVENEIVYDWDLIKKEFDALKIPDEVYHPDFEMIKRNAYQIGMSDRTVGKTTTWVLVGMIMNWIYGTIIQYVRATDDELTANSNKLVKVINEYDAGRYIRQITKGEYNHIFYKDRAFWYCWIDEEGAIVKRAPEELIKCLSIQHAEQYKSTYNAPKGDLIILDEFVSRQRHVSDDEPVDFLDLCCTIVRTRANGTVVLLGNTIANSSPYFDELEVRNVVKKMETGDSQEYETEAGTRLYIEKIFSVAIAKKKEAVNKRLFGFSDPRLNSITGRGSVATRIHPHIDMNEEYRTLNNQLFIDTDGDFLSVKICTSENIGPHIQVRFTSEKMINDNDVILSTKIVTDDRRYKWGLGNDKITKTLTKYVVNRKIFFYSNAVGTAFFQYLDKVKRERNLIRA